MAQIASKITPFLWYADKAEEAARFYVSVFPNSSIDSCTAMNAESPSGPPGSVEVVEFTLDGLRFVAMKAGVTMASIMAAESLWKNHHRFGAIGLMVASNLMMGVVAKHNAQVLSTLK